MSGGSIGTIVGGIVGGVIGYFTIGVGAGISLGASIGGGIGNAVDPPKSNTEVPRISDLTVQTSTYGAFIQRVYGTIALYGNIFWVENGQLKEEKSTSGGKGLGSLTGGGGAAATDVYTYSATFALGLCEGPITGVRRIWIGPKLVYDMGSADEDVLVASIDFSRYFKIYLGTDDQLPDPRMQMTLLAENTPAYRGLAYIVFYDLPLADYGNSLVVAQIKVEVIKDGQENYILELKDESNYIYTPRDIFLLGDYLYIISFRDITWELAEFKIFDVSDPVNPELVSSIFLPVHYGGRIFVKDDLAYITQWGYQHLWIYDVTVKSAPNLIATLNVSAGDYNGEVSIVVSGIYAYFLQRYGIKVIDVSSAVNPVQIGYYPMLRAEGEPGLIIANGDILYIIRTIPNKLEVINAGNPVSLYLEVSIVIDAGVGKLSDLCLVDNLLYIVGSGQTLVIFDVSTAINPVLVYSEIVFTEVSYATQKKLKIIENHLYIAYIEFLSVFRLETALNPVFVGKINVHGGNQAYGLISIAARDNYIFIANADYDENFVNDRLQVFFFIEPTISSNKIPLSQIVEAETIQSNLLSSSDLDVTSLTPLVRGYKIGNISAIKSAIIPLQGPWPFDVVQHGYKIKFILRGYASSIATITADQLDAHSANSKPGVMITSSREMDSILPVKVVANHFDPDREYDNGEQYEERHNTDAVNVISLDLPIVLTSDEAKQTAQMLLYLYWLERYDLSFSLPNPYSYLEPGDIITISTDYAVYELRLTAIDYTSDGRLECKAKYNKSDIYIDKTARGERGEFTGSPGPALSGNTIYELLDIPLLVDDYDKPGFPVSMTGKLTGWTGGVLYRTDDNGQTWENIDVFASPGSVMGYAVDAIGVHDSSVMDYASLLTVKLYQGELSSVTEAQLFNGQNWFAYGQDGRWEIIAALNCALQSDGSYILSDFLRGQVGTEWATGLHAIRDRLVLISLSNLDFIVVNVNTIGMERIYRGITIGKTIDTDVDKLFTYNAVNLKPLSPVQISASRDPVTNNWTIKWTRRSRLSGWHNVVDTPLGEASEAYEIDIYNDNVYTSVTRTLSSNAQSVIYTSAQQITDFGEVKNHISLKIYQLSEIVGRGYALAATVPEFYSYTLLLHCNGIDGGTTFIDSSTNPKSVVSTLAITSSAEIKLGVSSLKIGGTGEYLTVADSTDFEIGTGDFTIESWAYINSFSPALETILNVGNYTNGILFRLQTDRIECWVVGVANYFYTTIPINEWVHVAVVRSNGILRAYLNGVKIGTDRANTTSIPHNQIIVGKSSHNAAEYINGYLDEIAIVVGEAKYGANFTPQIAEF